VKRPAHATKRRCQSKIKKCGEENTKKHESLARVLPDSGLARNLTCAHQLARSEAPEWLDPKSGGAVDTAGWPAYPR
jgi:hypothetical protein